RVDGNRQRGQVVGSGGLGVGESPHRGEVDSRYQDDGMDAAGAQKGSAFSNHESLRGPEVVAVDSLHDHKQRDHRQDGDVGAAQELVPYDDDEHQAGDGGTDSVDHLGTTMRALLGSLPFDTYEPVPVTDHPCLAQRERGEDADDVKLDELVDVRVKADDQRNSETRQQQNAVTEDKTVSAVVQL